MTVFIAIAHFVGAIIATILFGVLALFIAAWEGQRNEKQLQEELSLVLGVHVDLESDELTPELKKISSERNSSELFRNRISDLAGFVQTAWAWLGLLLQIGVIVSVGWLTVFENLESAPLAWIIVGIAIFFWIANIIFSYVCKILTGRFPGQAKSARKAMAEYLKISAAK